jgi:hypothetical protein
MEGERFARDAEVAEAGALERGVELVLHPLVIQVRAAHADEHTVVGAGQVAAPRERVEGSCCLVPKRPRARHGRGENPSP